jgi:tripartite ATP-independent transporter DctM subunit
MTAMIGPLGLFVFFVLIALGVPIGFCLLGVGFGGLIIITGLKAALSTITSVSFNYIAKYTISVVPLFILMGMTASATGILEEVFDVARKWFGGFKGGEGLAAITGNTVFAAASGSSLAACVVIGRGALPAMRKAGYPLHLITGIIASSGTIAAMIPPSILICIYGLLVDESIGQLLIAGIIPGFIEAFLYFLVVVWGVRNIPRREVEKSSFWEKVVYTRHLWVVLCIILAVMGTIYTGVCTPTEAGAIGAFTVFLLCLVLRRLTYDLFKKILKDTVHTTGMVLFILVAAAVFSRFLLVSGLTESVVAAVTGLPVSRYIIFALVVLCYIALGCFLTATAMMVVSLPLFYPAMMALGFDSLWFGIMVVTLCELALITPPVGLNAYVTQSLDPEIPLSTVFRGCSYFAVADIIRLIILTLFPILALYLPSTM